MVYDRGNVFALILRGEVSRLNALSDSLHEMARAQLAGVELAKEPIETARLVKTALAPFFLQAEDACDVRNCL